MSTPTLSHGGRPKKEFRWKRLFIKAAGFGAGVALMLCLIAGASLWYVSRPKPPKPWDSKAIVASYRNVNVEDSDQKISFVYTLSNNTDEDFRLTETDTPEVGLKIDSLDTYAEFNRFTKLDLPVIIPARKKALVVLRFDYAYPEKLKVNPTDEERREYRKKVEEFLHKKGVVSGFILLDSTRRYQIDFPAGWNTPEPKQ